MLSSIFLLGGCGGSKKDPAAGAQTTTEAKAEVAWDDWDYIQKKGELIIGFVEFDPMNYYGADGKLIGFDTEAAQAVCDQLGLKATYVPINWDTYPIELETKNIDCVWNAMCITEDRKEDLSMTEGYLYDYQMMVVRSEDEAAILENNTGYVVTAEEGSIAEGMIDGSILGDNGDFVGAYEYFYNDSYVPSITMLNALESVKKGDADVALVDSSLALKQCRADGAYPELRVVHSVNFGQNMYGVGFRKNSNAAEVFNEEIKKLYESGKMKEIAARYGLESFLIP